MLHCISIGCKVNQAEMAEISNKIERHNPLSPPLLRGNQGGVCVLNTCAVTATAEAKSRKLIRRLIRQNPDSRLIVTGCLAQAKPDEVRKLLRKEDMVLGNKEKGRIPKIVEGLGLDSRFRGNDSNEVNHHARTRAFVKIQDGCNNFCSYCIVPFLRSEMWSKPPKEVDKEISELVDKGYKEVVLTGINLGKYSFTTGAEAPWRPNGAQKAQRINLVTLIEQLIKIEGIKRIRLSSIELEDVSDELVDLMVGAPLAVAQDKRAPMDIGAPTIAGNPAICPHLHIPLQSGSDRVLKLMKRHYTSGDFIERVNLLKSKIDNPSITTDIIVGFPGERDDDFQQTMDVCRKVGFSKIHIFPFSPRQGTLAFGIKEQVKPEIIKKRFNLLNNLARELSLKYKQLFLGKEVDVLVEEESEGFTDKYVKVRIGHRLHRLDKLQPNQIVKVKITGIKPDYVMGIATNPR